MKSTVLILVMLLCSSAGIAQESLPIIDMHLHAYPVGHFWPPGAPNPATGYPSPETDEELFNQTRAVMDRHNIVLAVTSGYPYINETIALLHAHPQVYADLAVINWVIPRDEFHTYLKRLVRAGFHDRLMFGSDQMFWPETIETAIESIESADFLTEEQKRDIFYHNAARFLRLSDEEIARHHGR